MNKTSRPQYDREKLRKRRAKQAEEGKLALSEYYARQQRELEKTARLRAERLIREGYSGFIMPLA